MIKQRPTIEALAAMINTVIGKNGMPDTRDCVTMQRVLLGIAYGYEHTSTQIHHCMTDLRAQAKVYSSCSFTWTNLKVIDSHTIAIDIHMGYEWNIDDQMTKVDLDPIFDD
jgi:hypothetical protein